MVKRILFLVGVALFTAGCSHAETIKKENNDVLFDKDASLKNMDHLFKSDDINNDGKLSYGELSRAVNKIYKDRGIKFNNHILQSIFNEYDINNDGYITKEEFIKVQMKSIHCLNEGSGSVATEGDFENNAAKCGR